jgi:hypothetical protein
MTCVFSQKGTRSSIPRTQFLISGARNQDITFRCWMRQQDCHSVLEQTISLTVIVFENIKLTSCCSVARSLIVLRSHIHALPSVPPVTATPGPALEPMSMKVTASILSPSVWPPSAPTTSPLFKLTTRTPPSAPPTIASVEEGFTPNEVMLSKSNRASLAVSLKTGVGERGSQYIKVPSAHAVTIRLPAKRSRQVSSSGGVNLTIWSKLSTVDCTGMTRKDLHCIPGRN